MSKSRVSSLAWLSVLLLLLAGAAWADSQARIVRLSYLEGNVEIDHGQGFEKAIMNMPITQGMRVAAKADGHAEIEFEDGSTVRLGPDTQVTFPVLSLSDSGDKVSTVQVDSGTAYFDYKGSKHNEFHVAFANQTVALDHAAHFRVDATSDNAQLAVYKGELNLTENGKELTVKKNETLTLNLQDPTQDQVAKGVTEQDADQWDAWRDKYQQDYKTNASSVTSPYNYGLYDLNAYGNWYNMPGYGLLWSPTGVGAGWDPYYNGYWALYPGYGYAWVSSYPWGWMPYRYGSWVYLNNYGRWAWMPGYWNNWTVVPRVVGMPPNYVMPVPPGNRTVAGGGGPIGPIPVRRGAQGFVDGTTTSSVPPTPATSRVMPMPAPVHPMGHVSRPAVGEMDRPVRAPREMSAPRSAPAPRAAPAPRSTPHASPPATPHMMAAPAMSAPAAHSMAAPARVGGGGARSPH